MSRDSGQSESDEAIRSDSSDVDGVLDDVISDLPGVVYRCRNDKQWTLIAVAPGIEDLTGYPPSAFIGDDSELAFSDVIHPDDREKVWDDVQEAVAEGRTFRLIYRICTRSGEERWVLEQGRPRHEDGQCILTGYIQDFNGPVVDRLSAQAERVERTRRARARYEEHSRRLEQTLSSLEEAVLVIDTSGDGRGIREANDAALRMFGYSRDELLGATTELLHADRESFERFAAEGEPILKRGERFRASYQMRRKDGTIFDAEQTVSLLDPEEGLSGGAVSVIRDVSRRTELERQLRQAQKMEAVGRLAGGIAHDFNNLLTVITSQADLIKLELPSPDPLHEDVQVIRDAADRAARLTRQLLAFSREQILQPRVVGLNDIVTRISTLLDRSLGDDVVVETRLERELPSIRVDPGQIEQVIMNLAVNARDAMPHGGTLSLTTRSVLADEQGASLGGDESRSTRVCLDVSDTGHGMDAETRARIFEPFFTTKEGEGGTGLGLSVSYGIVRQSGGAMEVQTEPGEGTTFTLRFPAVSGSAQATEATTEPSIVADETPRTILVIEDDPSVRRVARRILERAGYDVILAEDGETGLSRIDEHRCDIDLVLSDLLLPGIGGRELIDRICQSIGPRHLIAMSGYAHGANSERGVVPSEITFIQKPFSPDRLVEVIARQLRDR